MWQLPWKQGVEELQSCAALLLGDEADRRSRGIVLDNRIVWARVQNESFNRRLNSELQVLPKLVSIYLCCADGTGQVERDFGSLKKIVDVHSGPLNEDGDTASWLVEIFADGPRSEEEVATRLESSGAEGSDEVVLEATPFTRECAELWVAIFHRRFRSYSRGQTKPGPMPKEKAPPRQGTMKRVAYNCKLARDALASRVGAARSDITLVGDSRKTLQIVRAAPVVADAQPKAKAKSKANALSAKAQSKAKAKGKVAAGAAPQPELVRLANCHDVRALLQRVRRVHRQGGVASEYFARAG